MPPVHERVPWPDGGKMILGSDSHTRYGALGTMAIGEGGGELVKTAASVIHTMSIIRALSRFTWTGKPTAGSLVRRILHWRSSVKYSECGYVKNKVMEFVGPGISTMTTDFRNGVDVMTTETTCLTSIWRTDEDTKAFLTMHGRADDLQGVKSGSMSLTMMELYMMDLSTSKTNDRSAIPSKSTLTRLRNSTQNPGDILRSVEKEADKNCRKPEHTSLQSDRISW